MAWDGALWRMWARTQERVGIDMEGIVALLHPHLCQPPPKSREQADMPDRHACRFSQVAPKALQGLRALVKRSLSSCACSRVWVCMSERGPESLLLLRPSLPALPVCLASPSSAHPPL